MRTFLSLFSQSDKERRLLFEATGGEMPAMDANDTIDAPTSSEPEATESVDSSTAATETATEITEQADAATADAATDVQNAENAAGDVVKQAPDVKAAAQSLEGMFRFVGNTADDVGFNAQEGSMKRGVADFVENAARKGADYIRDPKTQAKMQEILDAEAKKGAEGVVEGNDLPEGNVEGPNEGSGEGTDSEVGPEGVKEESGLPEGKVEGPNEGSGEGIDPNVGAEGVVEGDGLPTAGEGEVEGSGEAVDLNTVEATQISADEEQGIDTSVAIEEAGEENAAGEEEIGGPTAEEEEKAQEPTTGEETKEDAGEGREQEKSGGGGATGEWNEKSDDEESEEEESEAEEDEGKGAEKKESKESSKEYADGSDAEKNYDETKAAVEGASESKEQAEVSLDGIAEAVADDPIALSIFEDLHAKVNSETGADEKDMRIGDSVAFDAAVTEFGSEKVDEIIALRPKNAEETKKFIALVVEKGGSSTEDVQSSGEYQLTSAEKTEESSESTETEKQQLSRLYAEVRVKGPEDMKTVQELIEEKEDALGDEKTSDSQKKVLESDIKILEERSSATEKLAQSADKMIADLGGELMNKGYTELGGDAINDISVTHDGSLGFKVIAPMNFATQLEQAGVDTKDFAATADKNPSVLIGALKGILARKETAAA